MHPDEVIAADPSLRGMAASGGYAPACVVAAAAFSRDAATAVLRAAGYVACFHSATADAPCPRDLADRMLAGHWLDMTDGWVALYLEVLPPALRA